MKTASHAIETFYPISHRAYAVFLGVCCHLLFFVSIAVMAFSLYTGLSYEYGILTHRSAPIEWITRLALALSFPLFHSLLLSAAGRRLLSKLSPPGYGTGQALVTTWFVIIASVQLLVVFLLWIPTGRMFWHFEGTAGVVGLTLWTCSWLLLAKSMFDSGISVQSGSLGWCAVFSQRQPKFPPFAQHGLFRIVREPIYLAFFLILWMAPTMTADSVFLATVWSVYLFFAPMMKESRYVRWHGERYKRYQEEVPYMFPFVR